MTLKTLSERFAAKYAVNEESGCWQWTAARSSNGYGKIQVHAGTQSSDYAHRVSYELHVGPIPAGLVIDHLCRNKLCVNPAHLEPVTARENVLRGTGPSAKCAAMTHCIRGHLLDEENTYVCPRGKRGCRKCRREANRRSMARQRGRRINGHTPDWVRRGEGAA